MIRNLLLASAATLGLATAAAAQDPTEACFVYVGPIGDGGWTYQHHQGALAVKETYGDKVNVRWQESVPEGADSERVITQMALSGCDIIFTTSFGYMDPTNAVAAKFPKVKFEHATGYKREHSNVSSYNSRFYEGRAVVGHIAGRMTKTNKIGYIASFPIPEVIMGINSYYNHAKAVNPDVELVVTWVYTWFDPAKEADAARAMLDQGVDMITAHTDSTAPLAEIAKEGGSAFGFGQASDMSAFATNDDGSMGPRITSIIDDWSPYYVKRVGQLMDGTYEQIDSWGGMPEGEVVIGPMTDAIPADVQAEAQGMIEAITAGEYHPFTGPMFNQAGEQFLADGETIEDGPLLGMNFYVQGITAEIPN
ncbi:MAG: BMP family ABC transporter substrate-binding protein [Marinovum sp.]|nr:BMP family ABC transporter substrate-binding protein [Marinovum sp.]